MTVRVFAVACAVALAVSPVGAQVFPPLPTAPDSTAYTAACNARHSAVSCICMTHILQRSGEGQLVIEREALKVRGSTDTEAAMMARHGVPPDPPKKLNKAAKESAKEALAACR